MPKRIAHLLVFLLLVLIAAAPHLTRAQATGSAAAPPATHPAGTPVVNAVNASAATESRWRIGAAFGHGERTNPLVQSEDIPVAVDLDVAWFGDRWFFDNGDAGFTFADNDALTASVVGRFNSDRVFFSRTETRFVSVNANSGVPLTTPTFFAPPDRDYAVELGLELLTEGRWGSLQLSGFHDASGTHDGFSLNADYAYGWRRQRFYVEPSIGMSYKSAALNDYYWGITAAEARGVVQAYEAGDGINWSARLGLGYQVNRHWSATLVFDYERLNDAAAASPIVEEHEVRAMFAGLARRF